ncbi:hypothetical protein DJ532_03135 [Sulfolobus sp. A20-N-F8]|nr:hypothetical protein DJ532_03135 [Sulfolobus sp. A20-N-F8]
MRIFVIEFEQDDPKKCTAKKMIKKGIAKPTRSPIGIILNLVSDVVLSIEDKKIIEEKGITVIDSSWNKSNKSFFMKFNTKLSRRLPFLLAGNPINYAKPFKLSSLEAIAASLFIIGEFDLGLKLLSLYKWGKTFYDLNKHLLDIYSKKSKSEIIEIEKIVIDNIMRGP